MKQLKFENIATSRLHGFKGNPKTHTHTQIEMIKKSIQKVGYISPIIVDEKFTILAGHGRVQALRELGVPEVQVIIVDSLTEDMKKEFLIADNYINLETAMSRTDLGNLMKSIENLDLLNDLMEQQDISRLLESTEIDLALPDGLYKSLTEEKEKEKGKDVEKEVKETKIVCPNCDFIIES